mmetsp:Transcript_3202/g.10586  ORF Transcript_3202/g.10586 Transcript_3202/m.10586 type:complete len:344 (-) Transcript_3202:1406-2437(-)
MSFSRRGPCCCAIFVPSSKRPFAAAASSSSSRRSFARRRWVGWLPLSWATKGRSRRDQVFRKIQRFNRIAATSTVRCKRARSRTTEKRIVDARTKSSWKYPAEGSFTSRKSSTSTENTSSRGCCVFFCTLSCLRTRYRKKRIAPNLRPRPGQVQATISVSRRPVRDGSSTPTTQRITGATKTRATQRRSTTRRRRRQPATATANSDATVSGGARKRATRMRGSSVCSGCIHTRRVKFPFGLFDLDLCRKETTRSAQLPGVRRWEKGYTGMSRSEMSATPRVSASTTSVARRRVSASWTTVVDRFALVFTVSFSRRRGCVLFCLCLPGADAWAKAAKSSSSSLL